MKIKIIVTLVILLLISLLSLQTIYGEDIIITNRTGTIKITRPDGTVLTVGKDEPLPDIPPGSIIKALDGTIEIIISGVKVIIPEGAAASISVDPNTGEVHVEAVRGTITVTKLDGEVVTLTQGESIDTPGFVEEPPTPEEEPPEEEPAEPERPEASPHTP